MEVFSSVWYTNLGGRKQDFCRGRGKERTDASVWVRGFHQREGSPVSTEEPIWGWFMHFMLRLHAAIYASFPQRITAWRPLALRSVSLLWKKRPFLVLYLKRVAPGYELKFNKWPWEGRDYYPPPLIPLVNLGALSLQCQPTPVLCMGTELGSQGCPAVGGRGSEIMGLSAMGPLGFPRCSSVSSPVCLSWKLWTPQKRSEKKNITCSSAESSARRLLY